MTVQGSTMGRPAEMSEPEQWFSAFLMLGPFNTEPHTVVTPLLLPNCHFATDVNPNRNT